MRDHTLEWWTLKNTLKKILLKIMLENDFKAKLNEKFTPPTIKLCQMGKSCSTCAKEMGWECWESIFNVLQPF